MRHRLNTLLKAAVSLTLLGVALHFSGLEQTWGTLSRLPGWVLPVSVVIYLVSQWLSALRWRAFANVLGFQLPLAEYYRVYLLGMFLSLFLPGAIGGDVGRVLILARTAERPKREALLTLLAERGMGLAALLALTAVLSLFPVAQPVPAALRWTVITGGAGMLLAYLFVRFLPIPARWADLPALSLFWQARPLWMNLGLLLKTLALSLGVHAAMLGIHLLVASALGISLPPAYWLLVYGLVSLASVAPLTLNGLGVREGGYVWLLGRAGVPAEAALAFGLIWLAVSTLTSLFGLAGWARYGAELLPKRKPALAETAYTNSV